MTTLPAPTLEHVADLTVFVAAPVSLRSIGTATFGAILLYALLNRTEQKALREA